MAAGRAMIIREGRFGAYVTDGEINATLRRGDDIETITSERAAELLAEKRAKGPTPKKRPAWRRQATAAATNSSSKQAAKKATAKTVRAKAG
jgi:DNA topoisomerase-1